MLEQFSHSMLLVVLLREFCKWLDALCELIKEGQEIVNIHDVCAVRFCGLGLSWDVQVSMPKDGQFGHKQTLCDRFAYRQGVMHSFCLFGVSCWSRNKDAIHPLSLS